ncbi:MAG: Glycosyl transferase group 1 [Parcubacteria group bacterium GW2011_GWA2_42_11]|nr:MAG: Glycosyl transferase group 1 [Parcubacteria group bacterium GW2011_GWA2_42_11]
MKKILYLITQSDLGGAQKNVLDLATALSPKYDISVAAGNDGGYKLNEQLDKRNIRNYQLKNLARFINPRRDWLAYREIKKLLRQVQPDILHLHSSKAGVLGSLAARRLPKTKVIYTVHGAVFTAAFSFFSRRLFLWLEKWTARYKDKIICVSQNDKNLWLKYRVAPAEKLVVIHNGIDLNNLSFLPREEAKTKLTNGQWLMANGALLGTIANFYPEKGLIYLIEAVNILKAKNQKPQLIIIGYGEQRVILENLIKKYNLQENILLNSGLPGALAAQHLKAFDIFILPSIKEGLPYAILEAMAAGLPIIASNIGGIPELVENDFNGYLVPPAKPEILAQKIAELLANPAQQEKFSQNSLAKAKNFSLEKMIAATEGIYF